MPEVVRAIVSAVSETYVTGTSTRKVQRVAQAMGIERLSKDQVSAICELYDESKTTRGGADTQAREKVEAGGAASDRH